MIVRLEAKPVRIFPASVRRDTVGGGLQTPPGLREQYPYIRILGSLPGYCTGPPRGVRIGLEAFSF